MLPDFLRSVLSFIVVLGVLVFVHELGHYLAARWRGVHVEAFSIGFGRAIASWTDRRGTQWKLCWLPLGGYVKLHGQERPEAVPAEVRAAWLAGRTFHEKGVGSRAIVVVAGPAANFLLSAVLLSLLFMSFGFPMTSPVVADLVPNGAAAQAGLQPGDRIAAIEGHRIDRFEDIQAQVVPHPGQSLRFQVVRGKPGTQQTLDLPITIGEREQNGKRTGLLGISGATSEMRRLNPLRATLAGIQQTASITAQMVTGIWEMITGKRGTDDLGGPLRIAQLSGQVAQLGVSNLIYFIALLSINLGLMNLFPVPILDGGHLVFYALEALRGRPVPPRAQDYGYRVGFALLIGLLVFLTWNDIGHLGFFLWLAARLHG